MAIRVPVFARGDHLRRHRRDPTQYHRPPAAGPGQGVSVDTESLRLLEDGLRKTMTAVSGRELDEALTELGWLDMLDEMPETAIPLVFRLLGETGAHAPVLNDVVLRTAGRDGGGTVPLPFTGGSWVLWERTDQVGSALGDDLPIHRVPQGDPIPLAAGRHAGGWWAPAAPCCHWRANMPWTVRNSAGPSRRSRRSVIGSPRRWSPSKVRRRPWSPPRLSPTIWPFCSPRPRP